MDSHCLSIILLIVYSISGVSSTCSDIANCGTCSNPGFKCSDCASGYVLNSSLTTCAQCTITNCYTCTQPVTDVLKCAQCYSGFVLKGDRTGCTACGDCSVSGCSDTNSDGTAECTACKDTFYLASANTCTSCGLPGCTQCTNTSQCTACTSGYALKGDKSGCTSCTTAGCTSCTDTNSDGTPECSACQTNKALNYDSSGCIACSIINNCATCTKDTLNDTVDLPDNCTACNSNYGFNGSHVCLSCPSNCVACSGSGATADTCTQCSLHYALSNDAHTCLACSSRDPNCQTCTKDLNNDTVPDTCTSCASSYVVSANALNCTSCSPCPVSACADANNDGNYECSSCPSYYALSTVTHQCTACSPISNCRYCISDSSNTGGKAVNCSGCATAFSLSTDTKTCTACSVSNCDRCSATQCLQCSTGYTLSGNGTACVSCSGTFSHCTECVIEGNGTLPTSCWSCDDGYTPYPNKTGCEACTSNCNDCSDPGYQCSGCNSGWVLSIDMGSCYNSATYAVSFSLTGTFTSELANTSSAAYYTLENDVITWLKNKFEVTYKSQNVVVDSVRFGAGSIVTSANVVMDSSNTIDNLLTAMAADTQGVGGYSVVAGSISAKKSLAVVVAPSFLLLIIILLTSYQVLM